MPVSVQYFESINNQIIETEKALAERARLARIVQSLTAQIETQVAVVERLSAERDNEEADVLQLEQLSLRSILYRLLGQHETQLSREVDEWLAAKLTVTNASLQLNSLQARHTEMQLSLAELDNCDSELGWLKAERERLIAHADAASGSRLVQLSFELAPQLAQQKELAEALSAGEGALVSLRNINRHLKLGRNADGLWIVSRVNYEPHNNKPDPHFLAKGSDPFKRRLPVRDAVKEAGNVGPLLDRFLQELRDLPERYQPVMAIGTPSLGYLGVDYVGPVDIYPQQADGISTFAAKYQTRLTEWERHVDLVLRYVTENVKRLELQSTEINIAVNALRQKIEAIEMELFSAENFQ